MAIIIKAEPIADDGIDLILISGCLFLHNVKQKACQSMKVNGTSHTYIGFGCLCTINDAINVWMTYTPL